MPDLTLTNQRGFDVSDEAVLRDIAALARHPLHLRAPDTEFRVPMPDGGAWHGTVIEAAGKRVAMARTFLSD
jgi:hypothetical protein